MVAFANACGGAVYIGISNKGRITGIALGKETLQNWINEVKNKTTPQIIPDVEVLNLGDKTLVEVKIPEYPVKPISYRGRFYKRSGNSNHLLSVREISDLYLQSLQNSWDSYLYSGATLNDLDLSKITEFIARVNEVKRFSLPSDPGEAMKKLNMVRQNTPTNAAMILFAKQKIGRAHV